MYYVQIAYQHFVDNPEYQIYLGLGLTGLVFGIHGVYSLGFIGWQFISCYAATYEGSD
jgi:hypothetical protein